ncbi:terminase small subunit [bacterium]|nr:terminase small subunit [bacterium]
MPTEKELTEKNKSFYREYVIDFNGTRAYQKVYGVGVKSAAVNASVLLRNTKGQAYIVTLIKKQADRSEKTADDVIDHLTKIAFSNLKDYVKWNKDGVQIKSSGSKKVDGSMLSEVSETITRNTRQKHIKLKDGLKALELLGRHFGIFNDKLIVKHDLADLLRKIEDESDRGLPKTGETPK